MKNEYSLDNLIKTFAKHAKRADKERIKRIKEHKEVYGDDLPEHLKCDFSISQALYHICKEIKELKSK